MKPKTKVMLSELLEKHSRASVIALRSDISRISDEDFFALLDIVNSKKARVTKTPRAKKAKGPIDDRPVTRIAHLLRAKLELSDTLASQLLTDALVADGVKPGAIPPRAATLETWLDLLLNDVPDSKVMAAAKRIKLKSGGS